MYIVDMDSLDLGDNCMNQISQNSVQIPGIIIFKIVSVVLQNIGNKPESLHHQILLFLECKIIIIIIIIITFKENKEKQLMITKLHELKKKKKSENTFGLNSILRATSQPRL
jgi:hypothetical protein